jgi:hypothetical protein
VGVLQKTAVRVMGHLAPRLRMRAVPLPNRQVLGYHGLLVPVVCRVCVSKMPTASLTAAASAAVRQKSVSQLGEAAANLLKNCPIWWAGVG